MGKLRYLKSVLVTLSILLTVAVNCQAQNSSDTSYNLQNKYISRQIIWANNRLQTSAIKNLLTGKTLKTKGPAFSIVIDGYNKPITSFQCQVVKFSVQHNNNIKLLRIQLNCHELPGVKITVVYQLGDNSYWGRKWIEIDPPTGKTLPVAQMVVESLDFSPSANLPGGIINNPKPRGQGQPVYVNDCFFGLEWPKAENVFKNNKLTCTHFPAWNIKGHFKSKTAVWGVAPKGQVSHWFIEKYIPTIRISQPKPILLYNSWFDIRGPKLSEYHHTIDGFRDNLLKKYGIKLQSFVIDDGWQNRNSIYQSRFPSDFNKLQKYIETELPGCHLGLWMPIGGGGSGLNRMWGQQHGYEVTAQNNPYAYDLLGPKYTSELKKRLRYFISDLNVNYFKHDFNNFRCSLSNGIHRTKPVEAQYEGQSEGMFRMMRYMKTLNPDVYLNYTSYMNMSPWWLMGCDCIWFGGGDLGRYGVGPLRERAITYRATIMHRDFVDNAYQFPPNAIMTHGIVRGKYAYGGPACPIEQWQHYVLMYFGRGVMMWELYLTPDLLTDGQWSFLAKTIKWAQKNADVLAGSTRFLLGNPKQGQPYGYAHTKGNRCIVFLRNPGGANTNGMWLDKNWAMIYGDKLQDIPAKATSEKFDDRLWSRTPKLYPYSKHYFVYRNHFTISKKPKDQQLYALVTNADENCQIFINGHLIGSHKGYGSAFRFNIPAKYVRFDTKKKHAKNTIALKIYNQYGPGGLSGRVFIGSEATSTTATMVKLNLSPKAFGFDSAYHKARISWVYPENKKSPATMQTGKTYKFSMKPFDVLVFEMTLSK